MKLVIKKYKNLHDKEYWWIEDIKHDRKYYSRHRYFIVAFIKTLAIYPLYKFKTIWSKLP